MKKETMNQGFGTRAIHAGQPPDPLTGAVMTPIYQTSTFAQESPGVLKGYDYTRAGNPTRTAYEECVAALEGAKHGIAFSSGCAALDAILHLFKSGDHVLSSNDVYGGTFRLFDKVYRPLGIDFSFVDLSDTQAVERALKPNTKLIWFETPSNPLLRLVDIAAVTAIARKRSVLVGVDNTFMSPYFQNPLALGADLVLHSVTKYMNGHSDVIGGVIATNSDPLAEQLHFIQKSVGATPSPMECFLVLRGLKTLHVRMERHQENALEIAHFLEAHPRIRKVVYPGLESHPQHALAKRQMRGFGGMITFFIRGGLEESRVFLEKVKLFTLAESLGGVESLIEHPAIMTHASIPRAVREATGITDDLIRVSVGIEDLSDLKQDLDQALRA